MKESFKDLGNACFKFAVSLISISAVILKLVGAVAAIILLYKMYPIISLKLLTPFFSILTIMFQIFRVFICAGIILYIIHLLNPLVKNLIKTKKRAVDKRRKKFIKDLTKEIKKE